MKLYGKPLYTLYFQTQEVERLLRRILQAQDIQAAPIFLDQYPFPKKILSKWPLRLVGFFERDLEIQSLFQEVKVSFLSSLHLEGYAAAYLAFSLLPLNQREIDDILSDPDCQGLCIMVQSQNEFENTHRLAQKEKRFRWKEKIFYQKSQD